MGNSGQGLEPPEFRCFLDLMVEFSVNQTTRTRFNIPPSLWALSIDKVSPSFVPRIFGAFPAADMNTI